MENSKAVIKKVFADAYEEKNSSSLVKVSLNHPF